MNPREERRLADRRNHHRWLWLLVAICALTVFIAWLGTRPRPEPASAPFAADPALPGAIALARRFESSFKQRDVAQPAPQPALTAEEIVARKLAQFARSRRQLAYALARRHDVKVSSDVEQFFAAVESGNWDNIEAAFKKINGGDSSAGQAERPPGVARLWPAIIDAYG